MKTLTLLLTLACLGCESTAKSPPLKVIHVEPPAVDNHDDGLHTVLKP